MTRQTISQGLHSSCSVSTDDRGTDDLSATSESPGETSFGLAIIRCRSLESHAASATSGFDWLVFACLFALSLSSVSRAADKASFEQDVQRTLASRCQQCHDASGASGGIEFESLSSVDVAMSRYRMWKKVVEQVSTGAMPPEGETPLTADEKQRLLAWVETAFDTSENPDPGPALVRQLTRAEYSQTMRDLLKFWHDSTGEAGIPHESVVDGFANRAGGQVLESSLMERYFTAADISLDKLFLEGNTG